LRPHRRKRLRGRKLVFSGPSLESLLGLLPLAKEDSAPRDPADEHGSNYDGDDLIGKMHSVLPLVLGSRCGSEDSPQYAPELGTYQAHPAARDMPHPDPRQDGRSKINISKFDSVSKSGAVA
jgi:hypothetical protein